jgi:nitrogen fixation protein FixH
VTYIGRMKYLLLALPLLLAACGSDADDTAGSLHIEAQVDPAPPRIGRNALHLQVTDAAGDPVEGARVKVRPFMPIHGHGSTETPVVTDHGGGAYTAEPLTLQMPGAWEVTISAAKGGENGELIQRWSVQ